MGLQDSRLLIAGTISAVNNAITGQAVAATNATVLSAYSVDLDSVSNGGVGHDMGEGAPLYLKWTMQAAPTGGTSIQFNVVAAGSADLSTTTPTVLASSAAIPVANLTLGSWGYVQVPPQIGSTGLEYLGASFTCAGAVTGAVVVGEFVLNIDDPKKYYASGFQVY
ncbi:MAG: hypothetical protein PHW13_11915 [Methylococcales bacterium]|nr:hypothetical protein [Methylococcales bacterium]